MGARFCSCRQRCPRPSLPRPLATARTDRHGALPRRPGRVSRDDHSPSRGRQRPAVEPIRTEGPTWPPVSAFSRRIHPPSAGSRRSRSPSPTTSIASAPTSASSASSTPASPRSERVSEQLAAGRTRWHPYAARALNRYDVAIVQHEYGIFGGRDGDDVLDVMARLRVPVIVVLHTVLTEPTPHQHAVLAGVVKAASVAVTMTATARDRLIAGWDVDPADVVVIAHGAEENGADGRGRPTGCPACRASVRPADDPDLGTPRRGQGNRVGARGDGRTG